MQSRESETRGPADVGRELVVSGIEQAKERCRRVIRMIDGFPPLQNHGIVQGYPPQIRALRVLFPLPTPIMFHLNLVHLSNIGYLESIVHILQQPSVSAVSRVCRPVPLSSHRNECYSGSAIVHVDVVCTLHRNPVWIIVSDRNPKYICWHDSHKQKGLKGRVQLVLEAAHSMSTLQPDSIVFFFARGLGEIAAQGLRKDFKATKVNELLVSDDYTFEELEGDWLKIIRTGQPFVEPVGNSLRAYQGAVTFQIRINDLKKSTDDHGADNQLGYLTTEADMANLHRDVEAVSDGPFHLLPSAMRPCSQILFRSVNLLEEDLINFDTTALIAFVSGISNGLTGQLLKAPEDEMRRCFKSNYNFVLAQVKSEFEKPIIEELKALICDKRLIICKTVCSEFKELVSLCGGPNEKLRADCLLKYLVVVPDNPSARIAGLPTTRKLSLKNKIVFGTGDYWHAPTLTANMGFVRAIYQTGMSLLTVEHRPRALVGD